MATQTERIANTTAVFTRDENSHRSSLRIGNRIYATSQALQEGPESEEDQDAIDGGDDEQGRNCGGLHGGSS
jgi:hypothetical protein